MGFWADHLSRRALGYPRSSGSAPGCPDMPGMGGEQDRCLMKIYQGLAENALTNDAQRKVHTTLKGCELDPGLAGGIYNLSFNSDGSLVAAACEQKNVLLCDPKSQSVVRVIPQAHREGVNCVRFLDLRTLATCSDDTTVALWDARNLKQRIRTLRGHSNWVKNIEYSPKDKLLLSSGFDGAVYLWDINKYSEDELPHQKIFYTNGLMRMRLSKGSERMVITTMNGYMMVIHNLDLHSLQADLAGFKPNIYRLMQISGQLMPGAVEFSSLFRGQRNRVEFICDFPEGNDAEIISSLELHPQGWAAVTRNLSADETSEWCCVHDIHAKEPTDPEDETSSDMPSDLQPPGEGPQNLGEPPPRRSVSGLSRLAEFLMATNSRSSQASSNVTASRSNPGEVNASGPAQGEVSPREGGFTIEVHNNGVDRPRIHIRSRAVAMESRELLSTHIRLQEEQGRSSTEENTQEESNPNPRSDTIQIISPFYNRDSIQTSTQPVYIHKNVPRLTHFIRESHTGRGFIKEIAFSPDGKIIASPFGHSVRILAFDKGCRDLSYSAQSQSEPSEMHEVGLVTGLHQHPVLSCAFSPTQTLIVSGCKNGKIAWHFPHL
eukprot:maker-scaffold132_size323655-snap-gene-0.11 protein:Tk07901 transcript:maker-scaffold132_size323655-snap-gene-0.11-mRNA-1 annotation:"ddb1- and cul4-associated factor 10 homolog isoform x1"